MKIIKLEKVGNGPTFSIHMESPLHNYMTADSRAVHANSHAISYVLNSFACLFLKAHFAPEWWASVMTHCHHDKLIRYMGIARSEQWKPTHITKLGSYKSDEPLKFGTVNPKNLTIDFTVDGNTINQGLIGIKGIGEKTAAQFIGKCDFDDIDEFIRIKGAKKVVMERLIKLGAFKDIPGHSNTKALWIYYQYKYCSGVSKLKKELREKLLILDGWDEDAIARERERKIDEYRELYPKRKVIPKKLQKWMPDVDDSLSNFMKLFDGDDYKLSEILEFEKQYLGYNITSPMGLFKHDPSMTIYRAKSNPDKVSTIDCIVTDFEVAVNRNGNEYGRLRVSDGTDELLVMIWGDDLANQNINLLRKDVGIRISVKYDPKRHTGVLHDGYVITRLKRNMDSY